MTGSHEVRGSIPLGSTNINRLLRPSVSMSLRLVIPWPVALQQSSPPLHQPTEILMQNWKFEKENLLNGKCAN